MTKKEIKKAKELEELDSTDFFVAPEKREDVNKCANPSCVRDVRLTGFVENNGKKFCCPACAA